METFPALRSRFMAKRTRSTHGRSGNPRKRAEQERVRAEAAATPELQEEVVRALDSRHPIDMVMLASSLLASLELDPHASSAELPPPEELLRMFLNVGDPQLMVLAWTAAQLLGDARLQAEIAAAVPAETVPTWLAPMARPQVVQAWQATDALRDSTDVLLSLRLGDADLTLVGLIDFNRNGALKDGFAVPAPLEAVQQAFAGNVGADLRSRGVTTADGGAWLSEAIAVGRDVEPPFLSDSWPQARPLLEWAARHCPPGGRGWERRIWSPDEVDAVVAEFAAVPEGAVVADPADRAVLRAALDTLGRQTYGDPLLLSAVKLEMGLGYLWATALHDDLDRLLALPDSLGPYVRWAHGKRGISADDTDEALAVIAHRHAEYVRDVLEVNGADEPS